MLVSYARGVKAMLELPARHPLNWFRHAFVHFIDCPHENWWFYVWHRGYIGHFERTIRRLSGDPRFTLPFWDWTTSPDLPAEVFDGVLTPTAANFAPFTENLKRFTEFLKPSLEVYWSGLTTAQKQQLSLRGYTTLEDAWLGVTGNGDNNSMAFATTSGSRYPTRTNRQLDAKTAYCVSAGIVASGLTPASYYDPVITNSFTSTKTESHLANSLDATTSILEYSPHNKLHNFIGGVGPLEHGPYGNMTNFLSPVDPIFFLHHANMDRLWDVWTKRQIAAGLDTEPTASDRAVFMAEPFLFFVDSNGASITARAGDYFSTSSFQYDYDPGFGSDLAAIPQPTTTSMPVQQFRATVTDGIASVNVPIRSLQRQLGSASVLPLQVEVTIQRPSGASAPREFDVLLNAPTGVTTAEPGSPYYVGTVALIGPAMAHHHGSQPMMEPLMTFVVPLPRSSTVFQQLPAQQDSVHLQFRVVPTSQAQSTPSVLRSVVVHSS